MDSGHIVPFDNGPVPPSFWSDYAEGPFEECTVCGRALAETPYEIQKVSNHRETVLEMAICLECSHTLAVEYSTQSFEAIRAYLTAHLDLTRTSASCTLCGQLLCESASFSAGAVCSGDRLVLPPIYVCHTCEEAVQELMSEQTRGAHDEFMNRTFPGVPADLDPVPRLIL